MKKLLQPETYSGRNKMTNHDFELFHLRDKYFKGFDSVSHDFYIINLCIAGEAFLIIEGKEYCLKPGDIFLVKYNQLPYKLNIEPTPIFERILIWISPDFMSKLGIDDINLLACFESHLLRPNPEFREIITDIILKLEKTCLKQGYGDKILRKIYITELLVYLNKASQGITDTEIEVHIKYNDNISKVIRYIDENLSTNLSLDILAEKFFISKYTLLREFKKSVGDTLHSYILQKRLIKAKELTMDGMPVKDVCSRCGFSDYSNFITSFKKAYGLPPKKYYNRYVNPLNKIFTD